MRPIKFRAWVGRMEYDIIVGKFGSFYVNPGTKGDGLDEKDNACLTQFNTKYPGTTPIMQFTGLHDKNGKEIWEGDIANITLSEPILGSYTERGTMEWVENEARFAFHILDSLLDAEDKNMEVEVLGNVYENPELLVKP